jgi:hypothetical protein
MSVPESDVCSGMVLRWLALINLWTAFAHDPAVKGKGHDVTVSFPHTCSPKEFSITSPETILPQVSKRSRPGDAEILAWYNKGMQECNAYYQNNSAALMKEKVGSPLMATQLQQRNNDCRGNAMFLQVTGLLIWPFGPIEECPTSSQCWFGYLTCGQFDQEKLTRVFSSGRTPLAVVPTPAFKEWSIRALDITTRVVGLETLVPFVSLVHLTDTEKNPIEILLAQYTLTIPGQYTIEMRLQGLYPGLLYDWKPEDLIKGVEMYHSIFFGGSECRCPPYVNCGPFNMPQCDVKSFLGKSPYQMRSVHRHVDCPASSGSSHSKSSHVTLPYCSGGNHPGRWIRVPDSVLTVCGADKYEQDLKDEHKRQIGKRQEFGKYAAVITAYSQHTQQVAVEKMWEPIKAAEHHTPHEKVYLEVLSRYSGGNICSLANIEDPPTPLDGKLEIFAPYDCKYRLLTSAEVDSHSNPPSPPLPLPCHSHSLDRQLNACMIKSVICSPSMATACPGTSMPH